MEIARTDLIVTARLQENRLKDLNQLLEARDKIHALNIWLTYLFHFTQAFGVFTVAICQALDLGKYAFIGVGMNILASVFEAIRQFNTKLSVKKLKDIDSIRRGDYVDEGEIDIGQDRQKSNDAPQGPLLKTTTQLRQPERAVLYKYHQHNNNQQSPDPERPPHRVDSAKSSETFLSSKTEIKKIASAIGDATE